MQLLINKFIIPVVKNKSFQLLLLCLIPAMAWSQLTAEKPDTTHQRDFIDVFKSTFNVKSKRHNYHRNKKVYYSLLPTTSQGLGRGNALITSTTAAFFLGDKKTTSISNVTFAPYFTLTGKFGFTFRPNIWLRDNKWYILGDLRFVYYPVNTWGLGGGTSSGDKVELNYTYIRFYQTYLKRIKPYFLVGFGYQLDNHINIHTDEDTIGLEKRTDYHYGTAANRTSISSGLSLNALYDTRNNSVNPLPGFYANLVYRFNKGFLGSDENWQSLYVDFRKYISFSKRGQNVLGFWSFYWTTLSNNVPYLDLPSIGWDPYQQRSGRGFDQNRYRGKGLIYFETEYRKDITDNGLFGFVVFSNLNSVAEQYTHHYRYWHPGAGAGLRIKFNKLSRTNVGIDYGVSKGFGGFAINLGETF